MKKQLKIGNQFRTLSFTRENINEDARTIEVSFSSEQPVERWFGFEILGHDAGECDLSRLNDSGAFLMDHCSRDQRGVIERAWLDKKGRAIIRLSKSNKGEELWQEMKERIRPHISVGYRVLEIVHVKRDEHGEDWYRVTKWQPYEISSVPVPADVTVGMDRSEEQRETITFDIELKGIGMPKEVREETKTKTADIEIIRKNETERCKEILSIGRQFGLDKEAEKAINESTSVDQFRQITLEKVRSNKNVAPTGTDMDIGLTDKEVQRYSLLSAVRASSTGSWKKAGFERAVSVAIADKMGKESRGFYVNYQVLAGLGRSQSTESSKGGELVDTELWSNEFIDLLRPRSVTASLGVRYATGLVGNVDIPKMAAGSSFYWIDEDDDSTDSDASFGVVAMSPKTVAGSVPITRRLMMQATPDIDLLIRDDLLKGLSTALDKAMLVGSGENSQPLGITRQQGVNAIKVADWDWETIVNFETAVAEADADSETMAYVCRPSLRGALKTTEKSAGTAQYLWESGATPVNGYKAEVTTNMLADAMLMGDFSQAMVGLWGAIDLSVDKAAKAASGGSVLRIFQDADVAVRRAKAFAYGKKTP